MSMYGNIERERERERERECVWARFSLDNLHPQTIKSVHVFIAREFTLFFFSGLLVSLVVVVRGGGDVYHLFIFMFVSFCLLLSILLGMGSSFFCSCYGSCLFVFCSFALVWVVYLSCSMHWFSVYRYSDGFSYAFHCISICYHFVSFSVPNFIAMSIALDSLMLFIVYLSFIILSLLVCSVLLPCPLHMLLLSIHFDW